MTIDQSALAFAGCDSAEIAAIVADPSERNVGAIIGATCAREAATQLADGDELFTMNRNTALQGGDRDYLDRVISALGGDEMTTDHYRGFIDGWNSVAE